MAGVASERQVAGDYYRNLKIQPAEFCTANGLGYCESQAIRYISRHEFKNGAEDIRKAIHSLELLLELRYPEAAAMEEGQPSSASPQSSDQSKVEQFIEPAIEKFSLVSGEDERSDEQFIFTVDLSDGGGPAELAFSFGTPLSVFLLKLQKFQIGLIEFRQELLPESLNKLFPMTQL